MPALTERELSNVEKLFNATRALLTYTRARRKYLLDQARLNQLDGGQVSAAVRNRAVEEALPLPMVSPSFVLEDTFNTTDTPAQGSSSSRTNALSAKDALPQGPADASTSRGSSWQASQPTGPVGTMGTSLTGPEDNFVPNPAVERRLWSELAFIFWRIAGLSKLTLLSYVTSDPGGTLQEVGKELLDYLQSVFLSATKKQRLDEVSRLGADHVLYMLKKLSSRRMCVLMLGGDSVEGKKLHRTVCQHIVEKNHMTWMSLMYVAFCDEAAYRDANRLYMPSTYVTTAGDVLRCIYHACAEDAACAKEMLYSEPVPCVTYMFYGLKLRIQRGQLLRPSEADEATFMSEGGAGSPVAAVQFFPRRRTARHPLAPHHFTLVEQYNAQRTSTAAMAAAAHASAYAASATVLTQGRVGTEGLPSEGFPASRAEDHLQTSSWGMNLQSTTRQQLGYMMVAGRQNCFDELCHLALDVAVEVVRNTDGYKHWAVMPTLTSIVTLSVKSLQDVEAASIGQQESSLLDAAVEVGLPAATGQESSSKSSTSASTGPSPGGTQNPLNAAADDLTASAPVPLNQTTKQVAMYENVLDVAQVLMALLKGFAVEPKNTDASPASNNLPGSADTVLRGSVEAMNTLQQNRETFLQDLIKCDFSTLFTQGMTAAPRITMADRSIMYLIEAFCTLDKGRAGVEEVQRLPPQPQQSAAGAAGGAPYASAPGVLGLSNLSFVPGAGYETTGPVVGTGASASPSFAAGRGGGGTGLRLSNLSLRSPRGTHRENSLATPISPSPSQQQQQQQQRGLNATVTTEAGGRRGEKHMSHTERGEAPAKENFAKSIFKSFFRGGTASKKAEIHADVDSDADKAPEGMTPGSPGLGDEESDGEYGSAAGPLFSSTTRRMATEASTRWIEVPSYVAIVNEILTAINATFTNESLDVELRLTAGFVLPPICLRDAVTFDVFEGRVTLRNIMLVLQSQVRQHVTSSGGRPPPQQMGDGREVRERSSLSTTNFLGFVNRALFSLERAYKVIGAPPLTSEAVILTELPLSFFCADGVSQPGMSLERYFTRVTSLWAIAVMGTESDEDLDQRSMEVLLAILQRALQRGSIPKDSTVASGDLVADGPEREAGEGTTTAKGRGQERTSRSDADSLSTSLHRSATASMDLGPGIYNDLSIHNDDHVGGFPHATPTSTLASAVRQADGVQNHSHFWTKSSFFGNGSAHFLSSLGGVATGGGSGGLLGEPAVSEHTNTLIALSHVCIALLHRQPLLLTTDALVLFFTLFLSHDGSMARLGRECVLSTFDLSEAYRTYAAMIRKEDDVQQVLALVSLLASYMGSDRLPTETRRERRVWMAASGCVEALIIAIVRCLRSPQQYAITFVKLVPQLFRLLSAFEPSQDVSPQLSETAFIDEISTAIHHLQGTEYFIIVTQAVLDAATCNFGLDHASVSYNMAVMGNFRLSAAHCAAVKTVFLELVPALAQYAAHRDQNLYDNLIDAFAHVVRYSGSIHSSRLVGFALDSNLSDLLPYMELPMDVLERLPFTGSSDELRRFWCPILMNAPVRSEVRFTTSGGVTLTIGQWPEKGFTLAFCVKYDAIHTSTPLVELRSHETAQLADSPALLSVSGGDSVQLSFRGARTTVNQSHAPQTFNPDVWVYVCVVLSRTANTLTVFLNGFSIGSAAMPYFTPGTEASVQIGLGDKAITDAFFSVGEMTLWGEELEAAQVEAYLAHSDAVSSSPKVLVQEVPRELSGSNAVLPIDNRIARFIPYENENKMLRNLIKRDPPFPVIAKVTGRHAALPQSWVDYHMLWATRGGILRMIGWLDDVTTSEELEVVLRLVAEITRRVTLLTTVDTRMYILLAFMLKNNTRLMSVPACDNLLYMGVAHVTFNDEDHYVVINRLLFEYVLSDCAVLLNMPPDAALYMLDKLAAIFNPNGCRHAKHNAQFVVPHRFVDRLLNSLVNYAVIIPIPLRVAVIQVARQVLVACEMETSVLSIFTAMSAVLTPMEQTVSSVYNTAIKVMLPSLHHTRVKVLPLRTAENLSTLLLRSLVESSTASHNVFAASFPRVVTLGWFTACVGRFADPVGVVYATWLFFDAMRSSPSLKNDVLAHQQAIIDALQPHAIHADLVLVLLAVTLGASKHLNLLSQRFSIRQQLDSVLSSFTCTEPNAVVSPIFVKMFLLHLNAVICETGRHATHEHSTTALIQRHQCLSFRVRRYFSLARVCSRLMLLINLKRYRATAQKHMLAAQGHSGSARGGTGASGAQDPSALSTHNNSFTSGSFSSMAGRPLPTLMGTSSQLSRPPVPNYSLTESFTKQDESLSLPAATETVARATEIPEGDSPHGEKRDGEGAHASLGGHETVAAASFAGEGGPQRGTSNTSFVREPSLVMPERFPDSRQRVRSRKYCRAFAVLRVCVLLWIPTVVRRYDWIFKPQARSSDQDLAKRHASTLFAVKAFRKYASQPSLYYTFVSSPMQTAALSSLINFVSKPLLQERISEWEQFLHALNPAPIREDSLTHVGDDSPAPQTNEDTNHTGEAAGDASANDCLPIISVIPPHNDNGPLSSSAVAPSSPLHSDREHSLSGAVDSCLVGQSDGGSPPVGAQSSPPAPYADPSNLVLPGVTPPAILPRPHSDNDTASRGPRYAEEVPLSAKALENASIASTATTVGTATTTATDVGSLPASSIAGDTIAEGRKGSDPAAAVLAAYARFSQGGGGQEGSSPEDESLAGPPTVQATVIPASRLAASTLQAPDLTTRPAVRQVSAVSVGSDRGTDGGPLEDNATRHDTLAHRSAPQGTTGSSAGSRALSSPRSNAKHRDLPNRLRQGSREPSGEHGSKARSARSRSSSNDSGTSDSSSSTARSHSPRDSLASSTTSLRPDALEEGGGKGTTDEATATPAADIPQTPASGAEGIGLTHAHDPFVVRVGCLSKVVNTVGDVVRREAIGVLGSLIDAALHILPLPNWIAGPTYGSCGGLLFQMLLITSSTAPGEETSATMMRYFLFKVAEKVKEEQGAFPDLRFGPPENTSGLETNTSFTSTGSVPAQGVPSNMHESFATGAGVMESPYSPLVGSPRTGSVFTNVSFARGGPFANLGSGNSNNNSNKNVRVSGASTSATTANTVVSDVFYFNVVHFTELVVDMISINVLDLGTANNYFLTLLVLSQSWPKRHIEQLSGQVLRACIAVLNRPSTQEVTVSLIEAIYTLTTLVLRRGYMMKGSIDCLFRVLYRVYASLPPVWMSEADAQRRKDLIALLFRHIMITYAKTKELQKALQVRTLTQRFSLYNDFTNTLVKGTEAEACRAFSQYCEDNASSMETLMAGRPKQKADAALKANIRIRGEYIKRVKVFNTQYMAAVEVKDGEHPHELRHTFHAQFSSFTVHTPVVEASQLHWLTATDCVMRGRKIELDDGTVVDEFGSPNLVVHYFDSHRNYATISQTRRHTKAADNVDVLRASLCEEQVNHISVLVPPFSMRCRPYLSETPPNFVDPRIHLSPSAITLLRLLLEPNERLRFISNAFRINGIHTTPCLVLLTDVTVKVLSFSRVTQEGDIILSEYADTSRGGLREEGSGAASSAGEMSKSSSMPDLDDAPGSKSFGSNPGSTGSKTKKHNAFSIANVTKQIQRLLLDGESEKRKKQLVRDGSRVAQSVRQSTGQTYRQLFWMYMLASLREVRCVHYMHLDTAVLLSTNHDDGPMLSFVDSTQSMNPAARAEFLTVLKDVMRPWRCTFVEDTLRPAALRTMLVRWATGAVSNYEYISFLNRVAGRTIKDFNQYPVFPWILRDYTSRTLDLEDPSTFRDLAYPMGAQTEARRDTVTQFYDNTIDMWQTSEEAEDPGAECFPFHHGTHYSTSAGVLYYLIRVEPFTTFAKVFQGGEFDIATRLFDSIAASYSSCVLGPADCKELVPEFYYNNMFLRNADHVDFGTKSDGEVVDDVKLPPWAKGSVQVFTAVMRYALESGYVMHNIHQWIDLIFGVRRRGPLALERFNVFQRMTYGEEVTKAIKQADTPHDMDVIIAEVDNFGQTPVQLFQERHPSHEDLEPVKAAGTNNASSAAAAGANTLFLSLTSAIGVSGAGEKNSGGGTAAGGLGGSSVLTPGATSANLANPSAGGGATLAGQTYTNAFAKESPKVMRMMVHALGNPQAYFRLTDIPPQQVLPSPPAGGLADYFRGADPAVTCFAVLRCSQTNGAPSADRGPLGTSLSSFAVGTTAGFSLTGGMGGMSGGVSGGGGGGAGSAGQTGWSHRIACGYRRMVPVDDTDHYLCWHERESRLMRFSAATGKFQSLLPFACPEDSGQRITAVSASPRESLVLVAVTSGTIYCLCPDSGSGLVHLTATLCFHNHPVMGFAVDPFQGRAISFTHSAEDMPIVWRVQRFHTSMLFHLDLRALLPCLEQQQHQHQLRSRKTQHHPVPAPMRKGANPSQDAVPHSGEDDGISSFPATPLYCRELEGDLMVVHACVEHAGSFSVVITKRSLFIFDNNGLPFGAGTLPMPRAHTEADGVSSPLSEDSKEPLMLEDDDGEIGYAAVQAEPPPKKREEPDVFVANMTVVLAYDTMEWAAGMQLFVTGHQDGSLSLWRSTRLPPDTVEPGRIAVVDYHATLFSGTAVSGRTRRTRRKADETPRGRAAHHASMSPPSRGTDGKLGIESPDGRAARAGASGSNAQSSGYAPHGSSDAEDDDDGEDADAGLNLGAVTALVQQKKDVPQFLVGFQSGATRLLSFDETMFQTDSDSNRKR